MFAFYFVSKLSLGILASVSSGLILLATALLIPEIKLGRKAPKASALVEEVSE